MRYASPDVGCGGTEGALHVAVENGRQSSFVPFRPIGHDRPRGQLGRDERLVHPVSGERIDEARSVSDEQDAAARRRRPEDAHGQPMAAHVHELGRVD